MSRHERLAAPAGTHPDVLRLMSQFEEGLPGEPPDVVAAAATLGVLVIQFDGHIVGSTNSIVCVCPSCGSRTFKVTLSSARPSFADTVCDAGCSAEAIHEVLVRLRLFAPSPAPRQRGRP
jgi:hypothetical protein